MEMGLAEGARAALAEALATRETALPAADIRTARWGGVKWIITEDEVKAGKTPPS